MRTDPRLAQVPVLALSASVPKNPADAPAGATRFFRKPFRLTDLLDAVRELSAIGRATQNVSPSP